MALGTTTRFTSAHLSVHGHIVRPAQISTGWWTLIDAAGMDDADNAGNDITNPTSSITLSTRKIVQVGNPDDGGVGTTLLIRMAYDAATTSAGTLPVVQIFGRRDSDDSWQRLLNKAATPAYNVTPVTATTTDVNDGTLKYTANDQLTHAFDLQGCNEILAGVKTAYAGSDGAEALAVLQGKII